MPQLWSTNLTSSFNIRKVQILPHKFQFRNVQFQTYFMFRHTFNSWASVYIQIVQTIHITHFEQKDIETYFFQSNYAALALL